MIKKNVLLTKSTHHQAGQCYLIPHFNTLEVILTIIIIMKTN